MCWAGVVGIPPGQLLSQRCAWHANRNERHLVLKPCSLCQHLLCSGLLTGACSYPHGKWLCVLWEVHTPRNNLISFMPCLMLLMVHRPCPGGWKVYNILSSSQATHLPVVDLNVDSLVSSLEAAAPAWGSGRRPGQVRVLC